MEKIKIAFYNYKNPDSTPDFLFLQNNKVI